MVDYWLYFRSEAIANAVVKDIRRLGFRACVKKPHGDSALKPLPWLVIARGSVVSHDITVAAMERLAMEYGGEYDGWDADAKDAEKIRPDLWKEN